MSIKYVFNPTTGNLDATDKVAFNGEVNAGSAASPSVFFTGDPDTGLFSPGLNQVALSTNGTGRLFIDSSGNVSIGSSSSTTALNVTKTSSGIDSNTLLVQNRADATGTTASIYFSTNTAGTGIERSAAIKGISGSGTATELALFTNISGASPVERLRITSTGLVGIGTSSPGAQLHVKTVATTGGNLAYFDDSGSGIVGRFQILTTGGTSTDGIRLAAVNRKSLELGSAVGSPVLYVDVTSSRVGIGTSTPGYLLDVRRSSAGDVVAFTGSTDGGRPLKFVSADNGIFLGAQWTRDIGSGSGIHAWAINGTERARIDSSGRLGIGTASPAGNLHVLSATDANTIYLSGGSTSSNNGGTAHITSAGPVGGWHNLKIRTWETSFETNGTERARIDSSGRLLVGTSTARSNFFNSTVSSAFQVEGTSSGQSRVVSLVNNATTNDPALLVFGKSNGSALNSNSLVSQISSVDTELGVISFQGNDGSEFVEAARIICAVDGTPGANDMPGRLVFSTTADGAASPTERMRITQAGTILVGKTANDQTSAGMQLLAGGRASFATNGIECIYVNRNTDDGNLIELAQAGTIEGTISVSGTTVSYNGAHLSRWSQLPSGAERTEILRGSVLSNIDEMCEWGEEDNEQLNRMKVSDVEGDKNVSGVFQAWDDDDDTYTNDFYCAMTGDFIIRIGAGVTVERGDLLMSAGDGTAKPQDDDIIRSKTIAKVTSTNVTCTYEDGSYCVPCVLMAC